MAASARGPWLAVAVLGAVLAAAPARAADTWRDACANTDPDSDSGSDRYGACLSAFAGGPAAPSVARRGDEMIRVTIDKGVRIIDPIVVLEFVAPKKGRTVLAVRDPTARGFSRSYRLPRETFETLRRHLLALREFGAPLHGGRPAHSEPDLYVTQRETVCTDGASGMVEAVLGGRVTHATLGACETADYSLVTLAQRIAENADPACAALPAHQGWYADELHDCLHLGGDRRLAAEGYGAAGALNDFIVADRRDEAAIAAMLDARAQFTIGGITARGTAEILARWQDMAKAGTLAYESTDAVGHGGQVEVRGMLEHYIAGADRGFVAPFMQVWRKGADGKLRLLRWRAGAFSPPLN